MVLAERSACGGVPAPARPPRSFSVVSRPKVLPGGGLSPMLTLPRPRPSRLCMASGAMPFPRPEGCDGLVVGFILLFGDVGQVCWARVSGYAVAQVRKQGAQEMLWGATLSRSRAVTRT